MNISLPRTFIRQAFMRPLLGGSPLIYPLLMLNVAATVMAVMLLWVIPEFGQLFQSLESPLPLSASILWTLSRLLTLNGVLPPLAAMLLFGTCCIAVDLLVLKHQRQLVLWLRKS